MRLLEPRNVVKDFDVLCIRAMRLRKRATPFLRKYLSEKGTLHGLEDYIHGTHVGELLQFGDDLELHNYEKVQILIDEILEPHIASSEDNEGYIDYGSLVRRFYRSSEGADRTEKFENTVKKYSRLLHDHRAPLQA